jgi:hypothetical protein
MLQGCGECHTLALYPQKRSQVPIFVQGTAWTSGAIETVAENLTPNGAVCVGPKISLIAWPCQDFNPTSSDLSPSHYNDHVILAVTTDMVWILYYSDNVLCNVTLR